LVAIVPSNNTAIDEGRGARRALRKKHHANDEPAHTERNGKQDA
jgi:hypothetical protein